eukprot:5564564-Ditylum_brightwellii.AAC.1
MDKETCTSERKSSMEGGTIMESSTKKRDKAQTVDLILSKCKETPISPSCVVLKGQRMIHSDIVLIKRMVYGLNVTFARKILAKTRCPFTALRWREVKVGNAVNLKKSKLEQEKN